MQLSKLTPVKRFRIQLVAIGCLLSLTGGAQPSCGLSGLSTMSFSSTEVVAITDNNVVQTQINAAGLNPVIVDVNVTTNITHTFAADLDIVLISPAGTIVTLTTDNGGGNDNVFNGTLWDDSANPGGQVPYTFNNGLATDHTYANLVTATPLVPEEAFSAFNGEDPNGTWTLRVGDDAGGDTGSLTGWSIQITTVPFVPASSISNAGSNTAVAIPTGPAVVSSTLNVSGAGTLLTRLRVTTFITHTFPGDLDITLTAPSGTIVTLTTDNGSGSDNVFNGTVWDDDANPGGDLPYTTLNGLVTDHAYVNLVVATPLVPEETFGVLLGENPNGVWTLTISDDAAGDGGSLNAWSLELTTIENQLCEFVSCPTLNLNTSPGQCEAITTLQAPATQGLCDGVIFSFSVDGGPVQGGASANVTLAPGAHTIIWYSTTACGTYSCVQSINVADTEPPTFNCNHITVNLDPGACDAIVNYQANATDNCAQVAGLSFQVPQTILPHGGGAITVQGNDLPGGYMFNLTNTAAMPIQIMSLEVRFGDAAVGPQVPATVPVSVYVSNGNTYVGQNANPAAWTPVGLDIPVSVAGPNGQFSTVPLPGAGLIVGPGVTKGVYVMGLSHSLLYNSAGNSTAVPFTNGDLSIVSGIATGALFGAPVFGPPRTPNIIFHYGSGLATSTSQTAGLPSGSFFPIGTTTNCFIATDGAGNSATCCFDVVVKEFSGPVLNSLACNDLVQISLDENCSAVINADMILEGGPYRCYDNYLVQIFWQGQWVPAILGPQHAGQLIQTRVRDPLTGNSCWGNVLVEDKLPPVITCMDFTLTCGQDLTPVFTPPVMGTNTCSQFPGLPIGPNAGVVTSSTCQVSLPQGVQIVDVNVCVKINHTWIGDCNVDLISPAGKVTNLWGFGQCTSTDNMHQEFDDTGASNGLCADINNGCSFILQPVAFQLGTPTLVQYNTDNPNGTWTLMITDNANGDGGTLDEWHLEIQYQQNAPFAPVVSDNCDQNVTLSYTDTSVGAMCDTTTILRKWIATDDAGNTAQCIQRLRNEPLSLELLECPASYIGSCGQSIEPDVTGWPTIEGVEIVEGGVCNIYVGYWDKELTDCGNGKKIIRRWTILDWCAQEVQECVQVIKLADMQGPELTCPANITIGTDPWFCNKDVNLAIPAAYDVCGSPFSLVPSVTAGTLVHFGGNNWRADDLPVGTHIIRWTATDACGNSSTCSYTITVVDNIAPVPVCDEHTVLTLTFDDPLDEGLTKIYATTFDDGSYDNCGPVTFLARRMDSCIDFDWIGPNGEYPNNDGGLPESIDRGLTFQPWVPFACCDVGNTIMVELRVTDLSGNVNSCMVEVVVQDKLPPYIVCPPDITVSCDFWFNAHETNGFESEDGLESVFGRVLDAYENDESDRASIIIDDPSNHSVPQPYPWGRDGWADDNCNVNIDIRTRLFDDCSGDDLPSGAPSHAVRLVERTFRAQDGQGNTSTCRQRVWVVDFDPFTITDTQCGLNNADDVRWPCDLLLTDCPAGALTPDHLSAYAPNNKPIVNDDNCSIVGMTYDDQIFYFVDNACYKILRKWTIIDWCQFDPVQHTGYWTYTQVIKVHDEVGPEFLNCPDQPVTLCVQDPGVSLPESNQVFLGESNPNSSACSAHVRLEHAISETCSDRVTYDVKLYPFNGVEYVQIVAPVTVLMDSAGHAVLVMDTKQNALPANHPIRKYGLPYNDNVCSNWPLAGGVKDYHRVLWSVEDGCGNLSTCAYLLRLEDCKKPTPICVGLSSVVMPGSGSVTIWAKDFDSGSSVDDCTSHDDLLFSFNGVTYEPSRVFDCAAIEANGSPSFLVEIWVADAGNDQNCNGFIQPLGVEWSERNKDHCNTFIIIDDNTNICGLGAGIGGEVETENHEAVGSVSVKLMNPGTGQLMNSMITNQSGLYQFSNPLIGYEIIAERNDDHKNGVSTLDLVRIQKHLLGIELLTSPYQMIAADANNSGSVSALDLVEIRKLILGLYPEFPKNKSWRFVDAEADFADPAQPWPFDEVISVDELSMGHNFIGVKIGDVNGNAVANAANLQTRNLRGLLDLRTGDQGVVAGQIVDVPVQAVEFVEMYGFQLTFLTAGLELEQVLPGALDITGENVGVHPGAVTMSWSQPQPVSTDGMLFTLRFRAITSGKLSQMLKIPTHTALTDAEAYDGSGALMQIGLSFGNPDQAPRAGEFALLQNAPNPFNDQTIVRFELPEAMPAVITVYNVAGEVVRQVTGAYATGENGVVIHASEIGPAGIYYYRIDAGAFSATKRMVLVR